MAGGYWGIFWPVPPALVEPVPGTKLPQMWLDVPGRDPGANLGRRIRRRPHTPVVIVIVFRPASRSRRLAVGRANEGGEVGVEYRGVDRRNAGPSWLHRAKLAAL